MSDTKAKPLAWRRISGEFLPAGPHLQYQAFMVKTIYYKNLAYVYPGCVSVCVFMCWSFLTNLRDHLFPNHSAYEITNFHHKEPPPKEILEDVSAKGGGILHRTMENFSRQSASREELGLGSQAQSLVHSVRSERDGSEADRERTPKDEKMDVDEAPGSAGGGRYSRCTSFSRCLSLKIISAVASAP